MLTPRAAPVAEERGASRNWQLNLRKPNRKRIKVAACGESRYSALLAMLRAHSLFWHYLWVAPNLLLAVLSALMCRRRLHKRFPVFFAYFFLYTVSCSLLYPLNLLPPL